MLNSQSVLRNDVTLYCLARWVWDLFWVECVFFFIVLAPGLSSTFHDIMNVVLLPSPFIHNMCVCHHHVLVLFVSVCTPLHRQLVLLPAHVLCRPDTLPNTFPPDPSIPQSSNNRVRSYLEMILFFLWQLSLSIAVVSQMYRTSRVLLLTLTLSCAHFSITQPTGCNNKSCGLHCRKHGILATSHGFTISQPDCREFSMALHWHHHLAWAAICFPSTIAG